MLSSSWATIRWVSLNLSGGSFTFFCGLSVTSLPQFFFVGGALTGARHYTQPDERKRLPLALRPPPPPVTPSAGPFAPSPFTYTGLLGGSRYSIERPTQNISESLLNQNDNRNAQL